MRDTMHVHPRMIRRTFYRSEPNGSWRMLGRRSSELPIGATLL